MKYLMIALLFFSSSLLAGDEVGNGGNAVVCNDKVYSLDIYETQFHENNLRLKNEYTIQENLEMILGSLEQLDPELAKSLKENFTQLKNSVLFQRKELPIIDDSLHLSFDLLGCQVAQAAINLKKPLFKKYKYIIQRDLFLKMDNINRTGLILHELVYNEILKRTGQSNSVKARFFTGILAAESFELLSPFEYHAFRNYILNDL